MAPRFRSPGYYGAVRWVACLLCVAAAAVPGSAAQLRFPTPAMVDPGRPAVHAALPSTADAPATTLPAVRTLRVTVPTPGVATQGGGPTTVSVATNAGVVPQRSTFSLRQVPADVTMDFDLPHGVISVDGRRVGSFNPVAPLTDNLRFPVDVTIHRGASATTVHRDVTMLLPTVIVPGFSNEQHPRDRLVMKRFARYGYTDAGAPPTMFWYPYQSHTVGLEEGARGLAEFVRRDVLPATYAARINVIGYSVGGLFARWLIAYDVDGWATLVNRLVMVAVPNEGAIMPYLGAHVPSFFPFAAAAKTPLAQAMDPVFPFWRATASDPWSLPADGANPSLSALNARPIPAGIRLYILYGSNDPARTGGPQTAAGVTGRLPGATLTCGPGDGVVLTDSALGRSINGSPGVPDLIERAVGVDVGRVYHVSVLDAGVAKAAAALQDRFETAADVATMPAKLRQSH